MRSRILLPVACLALALGAYLLAAGVPQARLLHGADRPPAPDPLPHVAALAGAWYGVSEHGVPVRLVVERVESSWATILYTWGDRQTVPNEIGSTRVTAFVRPNGEIAWTFPGNLIFVLSEDWTTLVGITTWGVSNGSLLLRRVPPPGVGSPGTASPV